MKHWSESEINFVKQQASLGIQYKEIAKEVGRSPKAVQLKMEKLGFVFKDFFQKPVKFCKFCDHEIENHGIDFCSSSCSAKFNNPIKTSKREKLLCLGCGCTLKKKSGKKFCSSECFNDVRYKNWIEAWKCGEEKGYSGEGFYVAAPLRRYLKEKFGNKCCKCHWNQINPVTGNVPVQINHIDGNPANNTEENLELICPNCHSLTPNYMALNKNSCRTHRKKIIP